MMLDWSRTDWRGSGSGTAPPPWMLAAVCATLLSIIPSPVNNHVLFSSGNCRVIFCNFSIVIDFRILFTYPFASPQAISNFFWLKFLYFKNSKSLDFTVLSIGFLFRLIINNDSYSKIFCKKFASYRKTLYLCTRKERKSNRAQKSRRAENQPCKANSTRKVTAFFRFEKTKRKKRN